MGLPCAHTINGLADNILLLSSINSQLRIDSISLIEDQVQNDNNLINVLCGKLIDKYEGAPFDGKKEIEGKLTMMLRAPNLQLLEPSVQISKGRPRGSSNKRKEPTRSTRREPSEFEIVEASLKRKNKEKIADTCESWCLNSLDVGKGSSLHGVDFSDSYIPPYYPFSFNSV